MNQKTSSSFLPFVLHGLPDERSVNHLAFLELQKLGYPVVNIRKAFHKLTGIGQPDMAETIGTYRLRVTWNIDGSRSNPDVQAGIAKIWDIPVEVLFPSP